MYSVLTHIGPIPVHSFGLMVTLGFIAGIALAYWLARRDRLPAHGILDAYPWILIGSLVGARLLYVLLNWRSFNGNWLEVAMPWKGGMSFHGGLAGGVLAGALVAWRRRLPFWALADCVAPALALGYAIGRIGCLLNGCCYGAPTSLPCAMIFRDPDHHALTPPSHPVQLYAALINLGIVGILLAIYRRKRVTGQVLVSYFILYSVYRFGVEFLRKGYTAHVLAFGLTQAQVASLGVALAGSILLWTMLRRAAAPRPAAEEAAGLPGPAAVAAGPEPRLEVGERDAASRV